MDGRPVRGILTAIGVNDLALPIEHEVSAQLQHIFFPVNLGLLPTR